MPHPGQKSVTLPADLVDAAAAAAKADDRTTSAYIARAVRRALDDDGAPPSADLVPQAEPVTPTPPAGEPAAPGEAQDDGHESGAAVMGSSSGGSGSSQKLRVAAAVNPVALPSPPVTPGKPSTDDARGRGGARPSAPETSQASTGDRSPRLEPRQGIPPTDARAAVPLPHAPASEPARGVSEISTWTCPRCHTTTPLSERRGHKCPATEDPTPVLVLAGGHATTGTPSPHKKQVDVDKVVRYVLMFLHGAKESLDRRAYLAAAVQAAHKDQGVVISDVEALEVLNALASRESAIERALEPPMPLDPVVSKSTKSPPTRAGGSRGRM